MSVKGLDILSYSVGESVAGIVCGVTDYGAFVRLEDGVNGMIHISKLSRSFISDIHSVIKKGDAVKATVISVSDGKIALSLVGDEEIAFPFQRKFKYETDFESMLSSFKSISDEKLSKLSSREKRKRR